MVVLFSLALASEAEAGLFDATNSNEERLTKLGRIVGRIELVPGVPMKDCKVIVEGVPRSAECDKNGNFDIPKVPVGRRSLRVVSPKGEEDLVVNGRVYVGVNEAMYTNVGTVVVSQYGAVHGKVIGADTKHLAEMVVYIADFGIATKPDAYGYYVLGRVPPGKWSIRLYPLWYNPKYKTRLQSVTVQPGEITRKVNFVMKPPKPPETKKMKQQQQQQTYPRRKIDKFPPVR
jgi:hypothetical protein